jgi:hypothetical protein
MAGRNRVWVPTHCGDELWRRRRTARFARMADGAVASRGASGRWTGWTRWGGARELEITLFG